ncbi:hypothetical protein BP5796_09255 [Coleophoma crateriformis]|uniref:Uncharacterized protein n=1 Tax=Coleophoma crateriformis TaxID=565419 RepID=A0A3D8R3R8_9HELO|nr:hypothetical protein BP5796_09255 [Coleophoma crateriformis]
MSKFQPRLTPLLPVPQCQESLWPQLTLENHLASSPLSLGSVQLGIILQSSYQPQDSKSSQDSLAQVGSSNIDELSQDLGEILEDPKSDPSCEMTVDKVVNLATTYESYGCPIDQPFTAIVDIFSETNQLHRSALELEKTPMFDEEYS